MGRPTAMRRVGVVVLIAGFALAGLLVGHFRQPRDGDVAEDETTFTMLVTVPMHTELLPTTITNLVANSSAGNVTAAFTAPPIPSVTCGDTFAKNKDIAALKEFKKTRVRCPSGCSDNPNATKALIGDLAYSGESGICRAALYEGVIGAHGGVVTVRSVGKLAAFYGNSRRGIG